MGLCRPFTTMSNIWSLSGDPHILQQARISTLVTVVDKTWNQLELLGILQDIQRRSLTLVRTVPYS